MGCDCRYFIQTVGRRGALEEERMGRFGTLRLGAGGESAEPFKPIVLWPAMLFAGEMEEAAEKLSYLWEVNRLHTRLFCEDFAFGVNSFIRAS